MQTQHQPLKRSAELAPLSREHHEGLLFVWKIKQGINFRIPPKRIGSYCEWTWDNIFKDHFRKEEVILSTLLPVDDVLFNTMMEDHQTIAQKMQEVIDDATYRSLERLAEIIYHHIRFEERYLFNHIEKKAPAEKLEQAAKLLSAAINPVTMWTDEFWLNTEKLRNISHTPEAYCRTTIESRVH